VQITDAFWLASDHIVELLDDEATAKHWEEPSALEGMTVGGLVAHVLQGVVWLERLLEAPVPTDVPVVAFGDYFGGFKVVTADDFGNEIHRYVRALAQRDAGRPVEDTKTKFREVLARLRKKLDRQPGDRLLDMRPTLPAAMRLDDRLRVEIVELVVHGDDLAASIGREDSELPPEAVTIALGALLESPRRRHGDRAVVRAMARRERTGAEVFPVL